MLFGIASVWYFIIGIGFIGFAFTNPPAKNSTMIVGFVGIALMVYGALGLYGGLVT